MPTFAGAAGAPVVGADGAGLAAGGAKGSITAFFAGGEYLVTGRGISEGAGGMASSSVPE